MRRKSRSGLTGRKRCSNSPYLTRKPKRKRNVTDDHDTSEMSIYDETMTAESLAMKLGSVVPGLVKNGAAISLPDLNDLDMDYDVGNVEQIKIMREMLQKRMKNFDFDGKTNVNFDAAAIAGAKIIIDERSATRTMTKRLAQETGIDEKTLMYDPLPADKREVSAAKAIADQRQESIVESFIDFQKQLKFKQDILEHVAKKVDDEVPCRRASAAATLVGGTLTPPKNKVNRKAMTSFHKTPKKQRKPKPLTYTKIMDNYADLLASEIKDRSRFIERIEPIPLDLDTEDTGY